MAAPSTPISARGPEGALRPLASVTLTGLFVYPVKSARGIALREAELGDRGIAHDRRFMIVDERRHFLTQRDTPALARLATALHDDGKVGELVLTFEGQQLALPLRPRVGETQRVRVFADEVDALDLGARASRFLSDALGRHAALVYMPEETRRQVDPTRASPRDIVGFADGFPYLLTNESSLAALNVELARGATAVNGELARGGTARLPEPVTMQRFRPNFVIAGVPAYSEDNFAELTIGGLPFAALKPCSRCVIVDTDPRSGQRTRGVLEALVRTHSLGNRPIFGQNLVARASGRLAVGAPVDLAPASR
jgi:uncharacterized protein YcbX